MACLMQLHWFRGWAVDNLEQGRCRLPPIERVLGAVDGWGEGQNLEHIPWVCGICLWA